MVNLPQIIIVKIDLKNFILGNYLIKNINALKKLLNSFQINFLQKYIFPLFLAAKIKFVRFIEVM